MPNLSYDLFSWKCFQAVVQSGSLKAAAQSLGMEPSSVTRRISHLASELGFPLLKTQGRSVLPTEKGKKALKNFSPVLRDVELALNNIRHGKVPDPQPIHIIAPIGYSMSILLESTVRFKAKNPRSRFWLESGLFGSENFESLGHGTDVIISTLLRENSAFVREEISDHRSICLCSPSFLSEHPILVPNDLWGLPLAGNLQFIINQTFTNQKSGEKYPMPTDFCLESDNTLLLMDWAAQGHGVLLGNPFTPAAPLVRSGRLTEVLPDWKLPNNHVYAYASSTEFAKPGSFLPEFFETLHAVSDEKAAAAAQTYDKLKHLKGSVFL